MNGGDRAALAAAKPAVSLALAIPPRHGVGEDTQDLAEQLSVERQREAQREGHGCRSAAHESCLDPGSGMASRRSSASVRSAEKTAKPSKEIPRLWRGGSSSLTFPEA